MVCIAQNIRPTIALRSASYMQCVWLLNLMHNEAHDSCGKNRVANPDVPSSPIRLPPVQLAEVGACLGIQDV